MSALTPSLSPQRHPSPSTIPVPPAAVPSLSPHAIPAPDAIPVPTTSPSPHNLSQAIPVPVPQHTLPRPQSARLSTSPLPTRSIVSGPDRGAGSSFPLPRGPGRAPAVRGSASSRAVEAQARRPRARLRQSRSRRSRRSRSRRRRSRSRRDGRSAERRGTEKADQRTGDRGAGRRGGGAQELQPPSPFHPRQGPQRRHPPRLLLRACPHRARPPGGTLDSYPAALLREGPQGERAPPRGWRQRGVPSSHGHPHGRISSWPRASPRSRTSRASRRVPVGIAAAVSFVRRGRDPHELLCSPVPMSLAAAMSSLGHPHDCDPPGALSQPRPLLSHRERVLTRALLLPAPPHASPRPGPALAPRRRCPLWASSPPRLGTCLGTARTSWLRSCGARGRLSFEAGEEFLASCKPDELSQVTKPWRVGGSWGTRPAPSSPPRSSSQDGDAGDIGDCGTLFSLNPFELRPNPALNWRAPEGSCVLEKARTFPVCRQLPPRVSSFLGVMNIALTQEANCTFTPVRLHMHWELRRCVELSLLSLLTPMRSEPYCCANGRDCTDPIKARRSLEWVCLLSPALRFSLETMSLREAERSRVFMQLRDGFSLSDVPQGTDGPSQTPSRGDRTGNPAA